MGINLVAVTPLSPTFCVSAIEDQVRYALGVPDGSLAVIGGTEVFGMFLPDYDVFHLTRAPGVWLPDGERHMVEWGGVRLRINPSNDPALVFRCHA